MESTISSKETIKSVKDYIKKVVSFQQTVKQHRKTEKFEGERISTKRLGWSSRSILPYSFYGESKTLDNWDAAEMHRRNRENLRVLYAAYGVMRGKTFSQIENAYPEDKHPLGAYQDRIDRFIKYAEENAKTLCSDQQEA